MSKKLFVGGLAWGTTDQGLQTAFAAHGEITEAVVITDRAFTESTSPGCAVPTSIAQTITLVGSFPSCSAKASTAGSETSCVPDQRSVSS